MSFVSLFERFLKVLIKTKLIGSPSYFIHQLEKVASILLPTYGQSSKTDKNASSVSCACFEFFRNNFSGNSIVFDFSHAIEYSN